MQEPGRRRQTSEALLALADPPRPMIQLIEIVRTVLFLMFIFIFGKFFEPRIFIFFCIFLKIYYFYFPSFFLFLFVIYFVVFFFKAARLFAFWRP